MTNNNFNVNILGVNFGEVVAIILMMEITVI